MIRYNFLKLILVIATLVLGNVLFVSITKACCTNAQCPSSQQCVNAPPNCSITSGNQGVCVNRNETCNIGAGGNTCPSGEVCCNNLCSYSCGSGSGCNCTTCYYPGGCGGNIYNISSFYTQATSPTSATVQWTPDDGGLCAGNGAVLIFIGTNRSFVDNYCGFNALDASNIYHYAYTNGCYAISPPYYTTNPKNGNRNGLYSFNTSDYGITLSPDTVYYVKVISEYYKHGKRRDTTYFNPGVPVYGIGV